MRSCHSPSQNSSMTSYMQNSIKTSYHVLQSPRDLALPFSLWGPHLLLASLCSYPSSLTGPSAVLLLYRAYSCCRTFMYMLSLLLEMLPYDLSMTHSFTSLNSLLNCSLSKEAFLDYAVSNGQPSVILYPLSLFYFSPMTTWKCCLWLYIQFSCLLPEYELQECNTLFQLPLYPCTSEQSLAHGKLAVQC